MSETIHANGSWVGDTIEEYKKLPTAGKIGVVVAIVAVIGIALYAKAHSTPTAAAAVGSAGIASGTTSGSGGGGSSDMQSVGGSATGNGTNVPPTTSGGGTTSTSKPPTSTPAKTGTPVGVKPITTPKPKTPAKPRPKLTSYTVVAGDNLSRIASTHGIKGGWQAIYSNGSNKQTIGGNPNLIRPGQKLDLTGLV